MEEGEVNSEVSQEAELEEGEIKEDSSVKQNELLSLGSFLDLDVDLRREPQAKVHPIIEASAIGYKLTLPAKDTDLRVKFQPPVTSKSESAMKGQRKSPVRNKTKKKCTKNNCPKKRNVSLPKVKSLVKPMVKQSPYRGKASQPTYTTLNSPKPKISPVKFRYSQAWQRPTIQSVDKDASYEDLLDQYRRIKLELNHIKIEEKHQASESHKKVRHQTRPQHSQRSPIKNRRNNTEIKRDVVNTRKSNQRNSSSRKTSIKGESEKIVKLVVNEEEEDLMELRRMALESRAKKMARRKSSHDFEKGNEKNAEISPADNYEQVDMDLDSDCVPCSPYTPNLAGTDLSEVEMDTGDETEEDEEDENALREQLLKGIESRKNMVNNATKLPPKENIPTVNTPSAAPAKLCETEKLKKSEEGSQEQRSPLEEISQHVVAQKLKTPIVTLGSRINIDKLTSPSNRNLLPRCQKLVINLADDSSSQSSESDNEETSSSAKNTLLAGLDAFISEARHKSDVNTIAEHTPTAVAQLSKAQQLEYRKLKEELARRKREKEVKNNQNGSTTDVNNSESEGSSNKKDSQEKLTVMETKFKKESTMLAADMKQLAALKNMIAKRQKGVESSDAKIQALKEQLASAEQDAANSKKVLGKLSNLVERVEKSVSLRKCSLSTLEKDCLESGRATWGPTYQLPSVDEIARKRSASNSVLMAAKKAKQEAKPIAAVAVSAKSDMLAAEKERLQKLEREVANRLEELKKSGSQTLAKSKLMLAKSVAASNKVIQKNISSMTASVSLHKFNRSWSPIKTSTPLNCATPGVMSPVPIGKALNITSCDTSAKPATTSLVFGKVPSYPGNVSSVNHPKSTVQETASNPIADTVVPKKNLAKDFFLQENVQIAAIKPATPTATPVATSKVYKALLSTRLKLSQQAKSTTDLDSFTTNTTPSQSYISFSESDVTCPELITTQVHSDNEPGDETFKFKPYISPLLQLKSYRISPNFTNLFNQEYTNVMHANKINCYKQLCRFDLTGKCNDDQCTWQHESQYTLTHVERLIDLLSYMPEKAGIKINDDSDIIRRKLVAFVRKNSGAKTKRLNIEKRCQKLVLAIRKHFGLEGPFYASVLLKRRWTIPEANCTKPQSDASFDIKLNPIDKNNPICSETEINPSSEERYFIQNIKNDVNLEEILLKEPKNAKLWLKLAQLYLESRNETPEACLNRALNTMSRALEVNQSHPDLWRYYLQLYSQHPESSTDILSMCQQALEYTSSYTVWWQYLELTNGYENKKTVCLNLLAIMTDPVRNVSVQTDPSMLSHSLLEVTFYLCQLSLLSGNSSNVINIFQAALNCDSSKVLNTDKPKMELFLGLLTSHDKVLLWLVYIYFLAFGKLPNFLFEQESDNPGYLVSQEFFLISWPETNKDKYHLISAALEMAIENCKDSDAEELGMLYINLAELESAMDRFEKSVNVYEDALKRFPTASKVWFHFSELYIRNKLWTQVEKVFIDSLKNLPGDTELACALAFFYLEQNRSSDSVRVLSQSVNWFYVDSAPDKSGPLALYRHILKCNNYEDTDIPLGVPKLKNDLILSDRVLGHLWISYGLLLHCLSGSLEKTTEALDRAVKATESCETLKILWEQYLRWLAVHNRSELDRNIFRCIESVPASFDFDSTRQHLNYNFHNRMVEFYCDTVEDVAAKVEACKDFLVIMPNNTQIMARLATYLTEAHELNSAFHLMESNLTHSVQNKELWKTCIHLALKTGNSHEVHGLYRRALTALPYCAELWNEYIAYEQSLKDKEHLKAALKTCGDLGINRS